MAELNERAEHGLSVLASMMGAKFSGALREGAVSNRFGADISRLAAEFAFSEAWGREGLARREKSLIVISILIALRQPAELKNHVKIGIANGLTVDDIENALVQAVPYVGFPAIATAQNAAIEALREINLATDARTSEERGLL